MRPSRGQKASLLFSLVAIPALGAVVAPLKRDIPISIIPSFSTTTVHKTSTLFIYRQSPSSAVHVEDGGGGGCQVIPPTTTSSSSSSETADPGVEDADTSVSEAPPQPKPSQEMTLKITANIPDSLPPAINDDFPDPAIVQEPNGKWWSYATSRGNGPHVQLASADSPMGPWTLLKDQDAKPDLAWTDAANTWAPDVQRLADDKYVLYHSAPRSGGGKQCLGAARAAGPAGPFVPDPEPLMCRDEAGGVIDVSGFLDPTTNKRYIVYKMEADLEVQGQTYTNPQFIRQVDAADGTTFIGDEALINWRQDGDGYLVEAPQIITRKGYYILFFSSQVYNIEQYDTQYAVADNILGPYVRRGQVIAAPMGGLWGPGGAQSVQDEAYNVFVFHGWCNDRQFRCMYTAEYTVEEVPLEK